MYNIGIRIYYVIVWIVSPFNKKAKLWVNGRKNLLSKIKADINATDKIIWFHAASLGEFEQGRPAIEQIKKEYPTYKILLTFYSPSGYELRKNYDKADYIYYLPIDTTKNAKEFLDIVNPQKVFFIKYEFWFNFLNELNNRNIPAFLISAIFRKEQAFFNKSKKWYRKILTFFDIIFVQDKASEKLLNTININNVIISGDTRYDRVFDIAENAKLIHELDIFTDKEFTIVAGSTWKPDEEILLEYLKNTSNNIKLIIAPHEIHKENIDRIFNLFKRFGVVRYSEINKYSKNYKVLIVDNIGLLSSLYKHANITYVGGGFGVGIHNTLEPASHGKPVLFGPNYHKFAEAKELISKDCGFVINNNKDFEVIADRFYSDKEYLAKTSKEIRTFIGSKLGATKIILDKIMNQ